MSRLRAPSERRTPISRVRSTTATSMMFMITIPPTPSETEAIRSERMMVAPEIWLQRAWRRSTVTMPNGSGALKDVWRSARSTRPHLVDRGLEAGHPAPCLDDDVDRPPAAEGPPVGLGRDPHLVVLALAEGAPLLGHEPDHPVALGRR